MNQRRTKRWPLSASVAVVALASVLVVTNGGVAEAKRLLTGRDIAANTITGKNIKDHSLTAADFSGPLPIGTQGAPGAQGPKGDTGAKGDQGIQGPGVPVKYYTWDATFTADGTYGCGDTTTQTCAGFPRPAFLTSAQALPANSYIQVVDFSTTGLSTCSSPDYSGLNLFAGTTDALAWTGAPWTYGTTDDAFFTGSTATHLALDGSCVSVDADGFTPIYHPIPSFTAKVTFSVTSAADMNAAAFN